MKNTKDIIFKAVKNYRHFGITDEELTDKIFESLPSVSQIKEGETLTKYLIEARKKTSWRMVTEVINELKRLSSPPAVKEVKDVTDEDAIQLIKLKHPGNKVIRILTTAEGYLKYEYLHAAKKKAVNRIAYVQLLYKRGKFLTSKGHKI